ncbi:unnamed protein product, partial [Coregonus sp. 'balchen']
MVTTCNASQNSSQCSVVLGGALDLQLMTNATPVSSPQLSSECLSHGEMRVSCSSEGDGPQYSWNLDGQTLRDTEASSDNETNTITLKKGLSEDLTCTVRNYISSDTVGKGISPSPSPVSSPQLSSQCLSHGEIMVTCSSEGQPPVHQDGQTLNGMVAFLSDMTDTVILKKDIVGTLD